MSGEVRKLGADPVGRLFLFAAVIVVIMVAAVAFLVYQSTAIRHTASAVQSLAHENATRSEAGRTALTDALNAVQDQHVQQLDDTRLSIDCLYLRSQGVRPAPCTYVNARIDGLRNGVWPYPVHP